MIGTQAPDIALLDQDDRLFSLNDITSRFVLIYFYPKDMTPGCTTQACALESAWDAFQQHDCTIIGISKDTPKRHRQFIDKYHLPFTLLSDPDGTVCDAFGVWIQKSMFGKRYMGIERSSFMLDAKRTICQTWKKVKPADHADLVLAYLDQYSR